MGGFRVSEWRKLPVSLTELCINTSLRCGQSFRWTKNDQDEWSCALHGRILTLRQDLTHLHYKATYPTCQDTILTPPKSTTGSKNFPATEETLTEDDTEALIHHYFNLDVNLTGLYEQWSAADANFRKRAPMFTGVRILRQDAWESLVGFICSSNNNIIRISQMVHKLCRTYGPLIGQIGTETYYDFPAPAALTGADVEQQLRQLGFGYRAKYLHRTALIVANEHEDGWLDSLRNPESPLLGVKPRSAGPMPEGGRAGYRQAHEALLGLQGVGPKVADCVSLMGLGWGEAVPVDTHVWQIAQRDYKFGKGKHSSLTKATYDAVGNKFRSLWGKEAGWAHSVLFTADLRAFSERLVPKAEKIEDGVKKEVNEDEDSPRKTSVKVKKELIEDEESPRKTSVKVKKELNEDEEIPTKTSVEVKKELNEDEESPTKTSVKVKKEVILTPSVKRESEEAEAIHYDDMMSRVKRRRKMKPQ